jgi:hypothetical protein
MKSLGVLSFLFVFADTGVLGAAIG